MFWKNKRTSKTKGVRGVENNKYCFDFPKITHSKSIIDGKLYDTENAKLLCFKDDRFLFKTPKGNYFSCKAGDEHCENEGRFVWEIVYYDIRPENIEDAKETIGRYDADRYIELFGEPEEA